VSLPDTAANQAAYPQSPAQRPGLGFPLARLVVVFCLTCGAALDAELGRYQGKQAGENSLLRALADGLCPGDVLLADRYFGGWFDVALWQRRRVDVVVRLHQRRHCDLRRGRRLGRGEHVVAWPKPQRPDWLDEGDYAALPEELELRGARVRVRPRAVPGVTGRALLRVGSRGPVPLRRARRQRPPGDEVKGRARVQGEDEDVGSSGDKHLAGTPQAQRVLSGRRDVDRRLGEAAQRVVDMRGLHGRAWP
jgi:hypothetical protein